MDTTVIIIGAGASGVTAASELFRQGIDFVIVEATEMVGGRVRTGHFAGYNVELGANWCV